MTDQPEYPSYPGQDGAGEPVHPTPPAPTYGQEPPAYGQAPSGGYGSVPPPPGGYGSVPPPPGGFPPGGYPGQAPVTNPKAVWALVLGILSITCCGFVSGIAAIILGLIAKKEIASSGGREAGQGMATAGFVTGIVGSVIGVLWVGLYILGLAVDA